MDKQRAELPPSACSETQSSSLSSTEATLLTGLAAGSDDDELADATGLSERALYQALADLWDRLGVDNRSAAISVLDDTDPKRIAESGVWVPAPM